MDTQATHYSEGLYTFKSNTSRQFYSSVTPLGAHDSSLSLKAMSDFTLIDFIASAQSAGVSFIDITWHPGLGAAGQGATASIQQSLVNASTKFAFKQFARQTDERKMYQTILAEILVLQHPPIRDHENIIDLYGVGWDVRQISATSDFLFEPVLAYENASHFGDLYSFFWHLRPTIQEVTGNATGWKPPLSYVERLKLCKGIAKALQIMHACSKQYVV